MSDLAIQVENIGKLYRLGEIGTGTISHDLNRWLARIRGKEDPYAKIGETNDRTVRGKSNYAWALKDVNFEVKQGEVLGIIGRNGAGKSTLLKILSKVTTPTTGQIKVKGRIASLLEVGTGFHPELTGRENVFLNGAILGMTRAEVKKKFDEIVDFSGVERYIDTPVKRYSSGMYVRLAFAVAAYLEPEILIIDEVLAVGDAEFQKKCLGRMRDVSEIDGRTVLFVSHNMAAIKNLCSKSILLSKGRLISYDETHKVLMDYLENQKEETKKMLAQEKINSTIVLDTSIEINYHNSIGFSDFDIKSILLFQNNVLLDNCYINFIIEDFNEQFIIHHRTDYVLKSQTKLDIGRHKVEIYIPHVHLKSGIYNYWFRVYHKLQYEDLILDSEKVSFEVKGEVYGGLINGPASWIIS